MTNVEHLKVRQYTGNIIFALHTLKTLEIFQKQSVIELFECFASIYLKVRKKLA